MDLFSYFQLPYKNSHYIARDIRNFSWNLKIFVYYFIISLGTRTGVPRKLGSKKSVCAKDQCFPYAIASIA